MIEINKIDNEELKSKNLSIESLTKELDNKIEESNNIKNLIQKEKDKLCVCLKDVIKSKSSKW